MELTSAEKFRLRIEPDDEGRDDGNAVDEMFEEEDVEERVEMNREMATRI
jgi:hypothetical protein